jgi:multidrug efflux pump subunit AcrB
MMEENYHLYLTTVDGRVRSAEDIGNLVIAVRAVIRCKSKTWRASSAERSRSFKSVTAQGRDAVLLNIQSQADGSTLDIANALKIQLQQLRQELPPDMHLAFFYDQSLFVRDSVGSVWDAILFGLILSVLILYFFLKNWGSVWTAIVTIPITVLMTLIAMKLVDMSFNMMTLGGIAASIGLLIDNAIIVVEAMCVKIAAGRPRLGGNSGGHRRNFDTAHWLDADAGGGFYPARVFVRHHGRVFPRAGADDGRVAAHVAGSGAHTHAVAGGVVHPRPEKMEHGHAPKNLEGGFLLTRVIRIYERALRAALRFRWLTLLACGAVLVSSVFIYRQLDSDFLPDFDEGGFVIDYWAPPGTSLTETSRQLDEAEKILSANPDVEGYSRRLGAEMGMFITEPYRGDFAVKLKRDRKHSTDEVIAELRHTYNEQFPAFRWDFPGILTDVIGDLQLTPDPVEIKIFSPDLKWLKQTAPRVEEEIKKIPGIVDTFDGLTETGPSINLRVRPADAARFGLSVQDIADAVNTALLGQTASYVLEGDRIVNIRVLAEPKSVNQISALRELPLRTAGGAVVRLRKSPT